MPKYAIGIDYGTLSGRALLVDLQTGEEKATAVFDYPHAVMDEFIPGSDKPLPPDWALQHPQDYIDVLLNTVPEVIRLSGADKKDIIGIGIDFTACTVLPVKKDGTPLCFLDEYKNNPHAYVKLWKHHAAQDEANRLNDTAKARGESFLARYGGKISSEWLVPKAWQILNEAPDIYDAMDEFIEATDWVCRVMTGSTKRSSCTAGYKAIWSKREGYPSGDFYAALDERMRGFVDEKLSRDIVPLGGKLGELLPGMAEKMGLCPGTAVAVGNVDAHVSVPAVGIAESGSMLMIMGTSTCHIMLGDDEKTVPGICGYVQDGVLPGFVGYEAGQSCVGDHFEWFTENCVPASYEDQAKARGVGIHDFLTEKAAQLRPGESGLVALDWWNGNRSVLVDVDLTGVLLGATLLTRPEEIYRALIEATAYGTRRIIESFDENGVPVKKLYASGGISKKNPLMMQIYADVTGREIFIAESDQNAAYGSALFGAVAAGAEKGGFDSIFDAAKKLGRVMEKTYKPNPAAKAVYDKLYAEYLTLHDYFGRGENDVMKRLKAIRAAVKEG